MADDYRYQIKPLPVAPVIGEQAVDASQVSASGSPVIVGQLQPTGVQGPQTPDSTPGGGGGGTPTCATAWSIGTINTSGIGLPCSSPTASLTADALNLGDGSDSAELGASACRVQATNTNGNFILTYSALTLEDSGEGTWINLALGDFSSTDDVQVKLQELNICHMGAPGKRKFVCGDAYAA